MAKKSTKHIINREATEDRKRDTFSLGEQDGVENMRITAYLRDDEGQVHIYQLPVQFTSLIEGRVTRSHLHNKATELDLANWEFVETKDEYVESQVPQQSFDPNNIAF